MKLNKAILMLSIFSVITVSSSYSSLALGISEEETIVQMLSDTSYTVLQEGVDLGKFDSLEAAAAEAKRWADSTVVYEGNTVWRFGDHLYKVYQSSEYLSQFASREAAVAEAKRWADSTVVYEGNTVWRFGDHLYRVYQGQTYLSQFASREAAVAEAKRWADSTVVYGGNTIWRFGDHLYRVYQGQTYLSQFASREAAVAEAKRWANSTVAYEGNTVWRFGDHLYRVLQEGVDLGAFSTLDRAIVEAVKWRDSIIVKEGSTVWKFGDERLIGSYTTSFSASETNRNYNIALSARAIDGKTVMPGEVFSFNAATGLRTKSNGYRESIVISGGKFVMGVGGGVCQTSTTLYNAVLKAGLQIVERHPHSQPVSYVPIGKDATVADYSLDFRFRNSRPYPVRIKASTTSSTITVNIYGR